MQTVLPQVSCLLFTTQLQSADQSVSHKTHPVDNNTFCSCL